MPGHSTCVSGNRDLTTTAGDDVLHLPGIVEAAESSPSAAREAAIQIRRYLSKEYYERPQAQYNAIMLVRILADNPGPTFTRNMDAKFTTTVKELLRQARDPSVQQMARETLESLARDKAADEGLAPLRDMWAREKERSMTAYNVAAIHNPPPPARDQGQEQNYFARHHRTKGLPAPHELAQRIEEAKTSAKLLLQVLQSTPPGEVLNNDLMKEFSERCQSASRSLQGYINATDPAPDDDTLLTLIETNDQLSMAISKYQRAVLQARKTISSVAAAAATVTPSPPPPPVMPQAEQQLQQQQREDTTNLDPFRDENQIVPTTLQAPLPAATIQQGRNESAHHDQGYMNTASSYQTYPYSSSAHSPTEAYSEEPYHPGHMQAQTITPQQQQLGPYSSQTVEPPLPDPLREEMDHPAGPQAKPSYSQRQVSAIEHTAMRGAIEKG
ncbi:MAG: hypothetical protein M1816_003970 [Peltula sp. TS41687]|nr:MAG: hypothetical protein M1816_003970 [Peltula sp. TS41687]